ncbi:MAG: energy transducer TonB [Alphaproteobacteria bacterium]|nr:energy transducer TonB [Alphaproteobacteria bacterium]
MQAIEHGIAPPPGRTKRRVTALILAGTLQAGVIYALVTGLTVKDINDYIDHSIIATFPKTKVLPPVAPPTPTHWVQPSDHAIEPPKFTIDDGQPHDTITLPPQHGTGPGPADSGPQGLAATHTIPPYPPLAIRLGEQGSVQLKLLVSPDGAVTDAIIVQSSGYQDLDQAARRWVVGRWRYRPAVRGGTPVASAVYAVVRFDLRNGG